MEILAEETAAALRAVAKSLKGVNNTRGVGAEQCSKLKTGLFSGLFFKLFYLFLVVNYHHVNMSVPSIHFKLLILA